MDSAKLKSAVSKIWDESGIPALSKFVEIPCKSPPFNPDWQTNGTFDKAINLFIDWATSQGIPGVKGEAIRLEGRTPLLFIEVPGTIDKTILFYGHMDKMPESEGWDEGLGPWKPVLKNDRLYGRGAADDGYAALAPIIAIKALREQNLPYAKCVIVMEGTEECGSPDFPPYLDIIQKRIGCPDIVFALDAGGETYSQIWTVSSLRGLINGTLKIDILKTGVHSGNGSGVAASTFRIARQLLSRIEDEVSGKMLLPEFWVDIPPERIEQARAVANVIGKNLYEKIPFVESAKPVTDDVHQLLLNQTWRPFMEIIGAEGLPQIKQAGNVLRASTSLQVSIRIPPMLDPNKLAAKLKETLEKDPPYGAKVEYTLAQAAPGWNAPSLAPWLEQVLEKGSKDYFGDSVIFSGMGGAIGVINKMNTVFPEAQFIVTGVLCPGTNEHVANESLCIKSVKSITCVVAEILAKHAEKSN